MITLKDFEHLRQDPMVKFKTETINGQNFTIICYMIADQDFWKKPMATDCRGIVFDEKSGFCKVRPLHKFFNVGERQETQQHILDFNHASYFEKRDGSMLTPMLLGGKIFWKTKKSFTSEVAISAAKNASPKLEEFCRQMIYGGFTPIFEYTDQQHQIVIDYGDTPKFVLLAARNIYNGIYMPFDSLKHHALMHGIELIGKYPNMTPEAMFEEMKTIKNFEGYVVHLSNGQWVKQKSDWYLKNHVIMTSLRERDCAQAVIDETIDDLKSSVSIEGKDIQPLVDIETKVVQEIDTIKVKTELLLKEIKAFSDRKSAAVAHSKNENFSLAMKLYDGKEPDFKKAWVSRHLKDYSLKTVYNKSFGSDE